VTNEDLVNGAGEIIHDCTGVHADRQPGRH